MALQLAALAFMCLMAHLEKNAIMWIVAGAMSLFTGLYWFDTFVTTLGLAFGLCFMVYGLVCFAVAYRLMLQKGDPAGH